MAPRCAAGERKWSSSSNDILLLICQRGAGGGGGGGEGGASAIGGLTCGKMFVFIVAALSLAVPCTCATVAALGEGSLPLRPVANLSAVETDTAIVLSWQETVPTNLSISRSGGSNELPEPSVYYQISSSADGSGWLQVGWCAHPCNQFSVQRRRASEAEEAVTGARRYNFSVITYRAAVAASAPAFAELNVTTSDAPQPPAETGLIAGITAAVVIASGLIILGSLRIARLLRDRAARHSKSNGNAVGGTAQDTLPRRLLENTSRGVQRIRSSDRQDAAGNTSASESRVFLTSSSGRFDSREADSGGDMEFGYYSSYWRNRSSNATYQNIESLYSPRCSTAADLSTRASSSGAEHGSYLINRPAAYGGTWNSNLAPSDAARRSSSSGISSDGPSIPDVSVSDRGTRKSASPAWASTSGRRFARCQASDFARSPDADCCPFETMRRTTERVRPPTQMQNQRRDGLRGLTAGYDGPADNLRRSPRTPALRHVSAHIEACGGDESSSGINGSDVSLLKNVELHDSFIPLRFFPFNSSSSDQTLSPRGLFVETDARGSTLARQQAAVSIDRGVTTRTLAGECLLSAAGSDSTDEQAPIVGRSWHRDCRLPKSFITSPNAATHPEWRLPKQSRDDDPAPWCWPDSHSSAAFTVPPTLAAAPASASLCRSPTSQLPGSTAGLTEAERLARDPSFGGPLIKRELAVPDVTLHPPLAFSSPAITSQSLPVSVGSLACSAPLSLASLVSPPPRATSLVSSSLSLASSSTRNERHTAVELLRRPAAVQTKAGAGTSPLTSRDFHGHLGDTRYAVDDSQSSLATMRPNCADGNVGSYRAGAAAAAVAERAIFVSPLSFSDRASNSRNAPYQMDRWQSTIAVLPPAAYRDAAVHLNFYEKAKAISFFEYPSFQPAPAMSGIESERSPVVLAGQKDFDNGIRERSSQPSHLTQSRSTTPPWEKWSKVKGAAADGLSVGDSAMVKDESMPAHTVESSDSTRVEALLRELHAFQNDSSCCRDLLSQSAAAVAAGAASNHRLSRLETDM